MSGTLLNLSATRAAAQTAVHCMQFLACIPTVMQELSQADKEEAGRVPRTLEVELTRDLVDSCSAGDVVTVLGIIKVLSTDAEAGMQSDILS